MLFVLSSSLFEDYFPLLNAQQKKEACAAFELKSTTQGFLPPRMTQANCEAIVTPKKVLIIYNTTTNALNIYNGSGWKTHFL